MENKYKLTEESIILLGIKLYRIEALKDFANVKKGDKGGYVESEDNLSQRGNCWIYDNAQVYGNALVYDIARVSGSAKVCGNAQVSGSAEIKNTSDYIVFKNWWSSDRYFTWTRSNNKWKVGCFYGTGKELIAKAYKDSELSGREYERVVKYVETIRQAELYSALAEGKAIQVEYPKGTWKDVKIEGLEYMYDSNNYRIKPEPKYRPFKAQEECWNEMLKHQPFGWVMNENGDYSCLLSINKYFEDKDFSYMFKTYRFVDATPFGIKEVEL